ncbi:MAG: hypothetical protein IJ523_10625 [Succinivibrionaceae bacterium]|nr:hypothetical protein [Succinivibrionaceae bacterium]
MDENKVLETENTEEMPVEPAPEYDPEEEEERRRQEHEAAIQPYKDAAKQRKDSAAIIAEHDNLLADMLFEITMNEMEG